MDDLEYHSLAHRAAEMAGDSAVRLDDVRKFQRLAAHATTRIKAELDLRQPKRPPIVFDVGRGLVSDPAGQLQHLPVPSLKGWRAVDLILRFGLDMEFPGCAALLTGGGRSPENALRNQCNKAAQAIEHVNRHLFVAIDRGIQIARNGAITLDSRDIPAITFDA